MRDIRLQNTSLQREIDDTEKEISRLEVEKSKALSRARALENELRVTRAQVDELLSTNLDNENLIRMKVQCLFPC
jgi:predicted nuclease with TOPRIM domain